MPADTVVNRYFEAVADTGEAIIEAMKSGNERGYRISNSLLSEMQRGQRDAIDLGRNFLENPANVRGFVDLWLETARKSRARNMELAREIFDELSESASEARIATQTVLRAQRSGGEAAAKGAREAATTSARTVRRGVARAAEGASAAVEETAGRAQNRARSTQKRARRSRRNSQRRRAVATAPASSNGASESS